MAEKLEAALHRKIKELQSTINAISHENDEKEKKVASCLTGLNQALAVAASDSDLPHPLRIQEDGTLFDEDDDFEEFIAGMKKSKLAKKEASKCLRICEFWNYTCFGKLCLAVKLENICKRPIKELHLLVTELTGVSLSYVQQAFAYGTDGMPLHLHHVPYGSCVSPGDRDVLFQDLLNSRGLVQEEQKWTLAPNGRCLLLASMDYPSFKDTSEFTFVGLVTAVVNAQYGKKLCPLQVPTPPVTFNVESLITWQPDIERDRDHIAITLCMQPVHKPYCVPIPFRKIGDILQKLGFSVLSSATWFYATGVLEGMLIAATSGDSVTVLDIYCREEKQLATFVQLARSTVKFQLDEWQSNNTSPLATISSKRAFLSELDHVMSFMNRLSRRGTELVTPPSLVKKDSEKFGTEASSALRESLKKLELKDEDDFKCSPREFREFSKKLAKLQSETDLLVFKS